MGYPSLSFESCPGGIALVIPGYPVAYRALKTNPSLPWFWMINCWKESTSLGTALLRAAASNDEIGNSLSAAHAQISFPTEDLGNSKPFLAKSSG